MAGRTNAIFHVSTIVAVAGVLTALAAGCGSEPSQPASATGPTSFGTPFWPAEERPASHRPTASETPHVRRSRSPRRSPPADQPSHPADEPGRADQPSPPADGPSHRAHHRSPAPTHRPSPPASHHTAIPTPPAPSKRAVAEHAVWRRVNAQRAEHGCGSLRLDKRLAKAARKHSRDMGVHHYFAHNSLDGQTPWDRIKAEGYAYPSAENIAKGYPTPATVMEGWMHSPGHRANILNCAYKAIGVGVWYGPGGPLWTQDFGFR